jgi:hypothetical protein
LDHSFYVAEFIPSSKEPASTESKGNQVGRPNGGITPSPSSPHQATCPSLDFTCMSETAGDRGSFVSFDGDKTLLDGLELDKDLQHIFDLISD